MELLTQYSFSGTWSQSGTFAAFLFALSLGLVTFDRTRQKRGAKRPPYAPGGVWQHTRMRMSSRSLPYWFLDVANELQTRVFQICIPSLSKPTVTAVGETSTFRAILTDRKTKRPEGWYGLFRGLYDGRSTLFTTNGPEWHAKRTSVAPAFASKHVRRMTAVALDNTETWIRDTLRVEEGTFDVGAEMVSIVLSALSETACEYRLSAEEQELFGRELHLAMVEFMTKTAVLPLRGWLTWLLPERRRAVVAVQRLKALVFKIMKSYEDKGPSGGGTLIELIMESDAFPTKDEKAAQLLEFLVAGHDTTAYSIAFILMELARNPLEQTKLRQSLREMSPSEWTSSKRLQRVVREGMRLHPVARSLRETGSDTLTNNRELVPKGSLCIAHFLMLFRNPDIFREPDSFLPSRWEDPSREMLAAYLPFSLGPQNCVGQSLARAEIFGIVARICSEFELAVECDGRVDFCLTVKLVGARLRARRVMR